MHFAKRGHRPRVAAVRHSSYPDDVHIRRDMLALREAGFDVELFCDYDPGKPRVEWVDGITVIRIPPRHNRSGLLQYALGYGVFPLLAAVVVAWYAIRRRYDWVEINNMPDWLMVAALVPKLLGARVILYSRDNMPQIIAADYGLSPNHPICRLLVAVQRACARVADRVITTHEVARQVLVEQGIPAQKLVIIPNSPDEDAFFAHVTENRRTKETRSIEGSFRLVTHGTLIRRYGIETLLHAVHLLRDRIPNMHLEIIGTGEYEPELKKIWVDLGLQSHVTFTGKVPFEDVAPRLLQADLGVVTVWTDFFLTNKLVEYLALGMPAIVTESAALRLYLDDTDVCFVPPKDSQLLADAILALYRDPARLQALATSGHAAYRKHFAWERAKHDYLAVYGARLSENSSSDLGMTGAVHSMEHHTS